MKILSSILKYLKKKEKSRRFEMMKRGGLVVGDNFNMLEGCIIDASHYWHIRIGDNVTLAPNVHILAHDASTKMHLGYTRIGKVTIGNRVFIGAGSIIMPGVTIEDNCIIGSGSIVTKDIQSNTVACGNPAKMICKLDKFLIKHRQGMEKYPVFSEEYTIGKDISLALKQEMNYKMSNCFGYVV